MVREWRSLEDALWFRAVGGRYLVPAYFCTDGAERSVELSFQGSPKYRTLMSIIVDRRMACNFAQFVRCG
jgi:hypothetical protein